VQVSQGTWVAGQDKGGAALQASKDAQRRGLSVS